MVRCFIFGVVAISFHLAARNGMVGSREGELRVPTRYIVAFLFCRIELGVRQSDGLLANALDLNQRKNHYQVVEIFLLVLEHAHNCTRVVDA